MSTSTDRAREKLQVLLDIGSDQEFGAYCDLLDLAIKQHESLREGMPECTHLLLRGVSIHARCPTCLVLLQWEQMWEEEEKR